jgi:hypothetical protein
MSTLPKKEKKKEIKPIKLESPIGFDQDVFEVTPKSPTLSDLDKYGVESLADNSYLMSIKGMRAVVNALLPDLDDKYKDDITFADGLKIIETLPDFI